jgi:hypothetical protein
MTAVTVGPAADAGMAALAGHQRSCAAGRDGEQVSIRAAVPDRRAVRSWPLLVLAAPAAVAVWSGWVGIGRMTGSAWSTRCPGSGTRCASTPQ